MDGEPGIYFPETRCAFNAFQDLVGEGGMSPGRVTYRERCFWLDAEGYDRQSDRGCRQFFHMMWIAIDDERQKYIGEKIPEGK